MPSSVGIICDIIFKGKVVLLKIPNIYRLIRKKMVALSVASTLMVCSKRTLSTHVTILFENSNQKFYYFCLRILAINNY